LRGRLVSAVDRRPRGGDDRARGAPCVGCTVGSTGSASSGRRHAAPVAAARRARAAPADVGAVPLAGDAWDRARDLGAECVGGAGGGRVSRALALAVTFALVACSTDSGSDARVAPTVRDSAGIQIVDNPHASEDAVPFWTVDTVPSMTIGVLDGDPNYEFT